MGLSNEQAREKITSLQVAVDIALAMKNLASRADLEQLAKDAYALPEEYKKQAEKARDDIATNTTLIAEQKRLAEELKAEQDNIDKRVDEIEVAQTVLKAREVALEKLKRAADDREAALDKKAQDLRSQENALSDANAKLKADQEALRAGEKKLEADQKELSDRIEKLKNI